MKPELPGVHSVNWYIILLTAGYKIRLAINIM